MLGDQRSVALGCLLASVFLLPVHRKVPDARRIKSPDGNLVAVFIYVGKDKGFEDLECRFEMRDRAGKILLNRDFSSADGEHGLGVSTAMWSEDSEYFAFSTVSSGGRENWHYPSFFYSSKTNQLLSIDELLDSVTDPNLKVTPEDMLRIEINYQPTTVDLEKLAQRAKPH
jgi:hypothetical protein